ncbi:hypothetical protein GF382_02575 [Candidatus Falkowbacteria bacterium]|nr:hypothetical protein [Candidatus Falkowbacteria bacterium]
MKRFSSIILSVLFLFSLILPPMTARAASASLYLSPSSGTYVVGARFSVTVRVNTNGAAINAAQGGISFDKDVLKVVGISTGGSVFNLWTTQPTFNNGGGTISFAGGVPHPGYTGSGGTICTITFQSLKAGAGGVRFNSGYVLANDGKGTNILSSMGSGNYTISPKVEAPKETPAPRPKQDGQNIPKKEEKPVERATYNEPKVSSKTHPDENKWFSGKKAEFSWELPDGVEGVSLAFDNNETANPGPLSDGLYDSKEYPIEKDGHWFFHIKFQDDKGRWGTITDFRVNSDNTPPEAFEIQVEQVENDWPILKFETMDELAGIDRYEIVIDDLQAEPMVLTSDKSTFKVENEELGEHTAIVRAYDRANNVTSATVSFKVETIAAPEIKDYTAEISPGDKFFISGTALPDVSVEVYTEKEGGEFTTHRVEVDKDGNWFLVVDEKLADGRYTAWAKAINANGLHSQDSPRVSFLVSAPIFAQIGSFVINYFTVLVSLLFMVVLIAILVVYLAVFIRKKLKKETLEIEQVLEKNLSNTKKLIEMEINSTKMTKASKDGLKKEIDRKIDDAKEGILKEVKDVEKILK